MVKGASSDADNVQIDFLCLDHRYEASRAVDQGEEDAFCSKMQMIGAKWWPYEDSYY